MTYSIVALIGMENLEDRWPSGTNQIEPVALRYLPQRYPST